MLMVSVLLDDVLLVFVTLFDDNPAFFAQILHLQANPGVFCDPPLAISLGPVPDLFKSSIRGVIGMAHT